MPGYNVLPPSADMSQPMTNRWTTPPTVAVLKFSLRADGRYEATDAKGHYSLDPATRTITWLDGPYRQALTKTQAGKRDNGAPSLGFVMNKRYYGCFMPEWQGPQVASTDTTANGLAKQYAGNWICRSVRPGYTAQPWINDLSSRRTTAPMLAELRFSLRADGTYEAPDAKGRYSLDPATKAITWLDGPYQQALTKTVAKKRDDGTPSLGLVRDQRYYGCFMAARRGPAW
jgi:hypothetical protein